MLLRLYLASCLYAFLSPFAYSCPFEEVLLPHEEVDLEAAARLEAYAKAYLTPVPADNELRRRELLARLGQIPDLGKRGKKLLGLAPKVVKSEFEPAQGGIDSPILSSDQYGDTYTSSKALPALEPFFNIHRHVPTIGGNRFLREADPTFPRESLTNEELQTLEPLPQRDPLRSYLGGCLIRIFTQDRDKGVGSYKQGRWPDGMYEDALNYFVRKDGTYYLYDFPFGGGISPDGLLRGGERRAGSYNHFGRDLPKWHVAWALTAISREPDPRERKRNVRFLTDSIFLFRDVGLRQLLLSYSKDREALAHLRMQEIEQNKTRLSRFKKKMGWLKSVGDPRSYSYGWENAENYLTFPLFFHKLLQVAKEENLLNDVSPEVLSDFDRVFQDSVREYQKSLEGLEAKFNDPDFPRKNEILQRNLTNLRSYSFTGPWY